MEALPAVEAAAKALENLRKEDLTELKNFTNPPEAVKQVTYQLVHLRPTGEKLEESWVDGKKILGNGGLLNLLKGYDKDSITEKQIKGVKKWYGGQSPDDALEKMKVISVAGSGLLTWVNAIVKYYEVAKNVEPLRKKVKELYSVKVGE